MDIRHPRLLRAAVLLLPLLATGCAVVPDGGVVYTPAHRAPAYPAGYGYGYGYPVRPPAATIHVAPPPVIVRPAPAPVVVLPPPRPHAWGWRGADRPHGHWHGHHDGDRGDRGGHGWRHGR